MRLERASAYGVLALLFLAGNETTDPAQVQDISAATGVPIEYLRKILGRLGRARLIRSIRGRRGGFKLARQTRRISMLEIVEAIEGPIDDAAILADDLLAQRRDGVRRRLAQWRGDATSQLRTMLGATSLHDLLTN